MFRLIKIILNKDRYNSSTLFNPFKQKNHWKVFFKNVCYELFWRNWWRDDQKEITKIYEHTKNLENRIKELENQGRWKRNI